MNTSLKEEYFFLKKWVAPCLPPKSPSCTDSGPVTVYGFVLSKLESLAIGVIEQAYSLNVEKTLLLIQRPSVYWGHLSNLSLAALASDEAHDFNIAR